MNALTSGIILYSFYQCICMDRDGNEPERGESGIRLYGPGDPIFVTTLRVTETESNLLHEMIKSHENSKPKDGSKGSDPSGPNLEKIRRNDDGSPVFTHTLQLTQEEAEELKKLLETQGQSGDKKGPSPDPSAPPQERPPPYAPGHAPTQVPGGYGPQGHYAPGATGGYGGYAQPGPSAPPYPSQLQGGYGGYGQTGPAGPYGTGYGPAQGPSAPPGYGGGYPTQVPGGYQQPGPSAPPPPGYGQQGQGYTGAAGGYPSGYDPTQQGATGYTPSGGQGPSGPPDPSGPSDPSGLPDTGKNGEKLIPLETKDTESSNSVDVLEYKVPGRGGKHRCYKPKDGYGFNVVTHAGSEVWRMSGPHHGTEVTVMGVGSPKKKMDIKFSDGTRSRFGKGGKNKPWEQKVEKK